MDLVNKTLSGVNTYTGGTLVSAGTVVVTSPSALPQGSALTVGAGGAFVSEASAAVSTLAGVVADSRSLGPEVVAAALHCIAFARGTTFNDGFPWTSQRYRFVVTNSTPLATTGVQ